MRVREPMDDVPTFRRMPTQYEHDVMDAPGWHFPYWVEWAMVTGMMICVWVLL